MNLYSRGFRYQRRETEFLKLYKHTARRSHSQLSFRSVFKKQVFLCVGLTVTCTSDNPDTVSLGHVPESNIPPFVRDTVPFPSASHSGEAWRKGVGA